MTPRYDYEGVRQLVIAQIQSMTGWRHARHLFTGITTQGAVIGDRTFDVRTGAARPTSGRGSGMERVALQITLRLRHRASLLQGAGGTDPTNTDRQAVRRRMQTRGLSIPTAISVRWLSDAPPQTRVSGFQDIDQLFEMEFWTDLTVPGPGAVAGVL